MGQGSSVGIATFNEVDSPGIKTGPEAHATSYTMVIPQVKAAGDLTTESAPSRLDSGNTDPLRYKCFI